MPHDPSTCLRCRWAAEREGYRRYAVESGQGYKEELGPWIKPNMPCVSAATGFCTSLDAVAGLMKEMQEYGVWVHRWVQGPDVWRYSKVEWSHDPKVFARIPLYYDSPKDLPGACVIEAAMRVLGDKESDE